MARAAVAAPPEVRHIVLLQATWTSFRGLIVSYGKVLILCELQEEVAVSTAKSAYGFDLVKQQYVAEYASDIHLYRHAKTGAPPSY